MVLQKETAAAKKEKEESSSSEEESSEDEEEEDKKEKPKPAEKKVTSFAYAFEYTHLLSLVTCVDFKTINMNMPRFK